MQILRMTGSQYAFYGFITDNESMWTIYTWSKDVFKDCEVEKPILKYPVAEAGIWANAVHQKKPILINDYLADHPGKKGTPKGHVEITRLLSVPIFINGQIVALAVVANKPSDYVNDDIKNIETFVVSVQVLLDRQQAHENLKRNRDELEQRVKERTVELSKSNEALKQEIEERKLAEEQIEASLKEKEVLLREIHHRVKNNMQVIISLLRLQADKIENKKYADMFKDSQNRIKSMSLIHEKLYQTQDFANIDFGEHVESLVNGLFVSHGIDTNKVKLNIDIKDVSLDLENAIPCGLIINELVSNSLKYAFPQGREGNISIALRPFNEDELELKVSDDGVGISEDLDIEQTDTMGLTLVKVLAGHQLDGKIELTRSKGTQFKIKFKRAAYKPRV